MTYSSFSFKALLIAAALALPGLAFAEAPAMTKGGMLVDHNGMTLYTFDKDDKGDKGKSNCIDVCADKWPPLMVQGDHKGMGKWTIIKRDDNTMQWAYSGKPLYTYAADKQGEMTGEGVGGVWHVAKP